MISTDDNVAAGVLDDALSLARQLIDRAAAPSSRAERATRERVRRLMGDERAVGVTIALTDEVMRYASDRAASRALREAVQGATSAGFGFWNLAGLRAAALASRVAPSLIRHAVADRVRRLTESLILDADPVSLSRQFATHADEGLKLNVNVLGEAVLGEREARDRLERVLEMMSRPDVDYVSVKLSSVVSHLLTIDHHGSLARVSETLRTLYRAATATGTFVNLDMEEYRDLRLTLDAFTGVLDEADFTDLDAGVVLQAYLPDSHQALEDLIEWSRRRQARGGGAVKVRLVKGANLAMEHVEAELHGWRAAPYSSKAAVDASYLRLLDVALRPEHEPFLRVGVASHNLFHVAWALELAKSRGVSEQLDVEMLEGMANAEARALVHLGRTVLLYAPVTRRDDFPAAVAYLVRRLDENTAPENYLRAALFIANDPAIFDEQRRRFLDALDARHHVLVERRRQALLPSGAGFENQPDGDPTDPDYVAAVTMSLADVREPEGVVIDTLGHLDEHDEPQYEEGRDPSDGGRVWYRYRVASRREVDRVLEFASSGFARWHSTPLEERVAVLRRAGDVMASQRARTIAVMARDGGKTVAEADPEVSEGVDFARFYAAHASEAHGSTPLGVVVVVPPWNFPYAIPAGGVLAALAAGNAVVLKPAPETVAVAHELVNQLWEAGVPRDVLQMVPTRDDDTGRHLVTHVGVSAVVLTGSFETARLFTSWRPSLRLLAETSGKNAMVITASADVDLAIKDLVHSAFGHAGQKCSAASLAIVEQAMFDDPRFLAQLVDAVRGLRVGAAYDLATETGPIIRPPEAALVRALGELDEGESWLVEPVPLDDRGLLWRPGVKLGVRPGSWSHLNEWFGPVLGVMVAKDLDEAIDWQNQTPYALTAGLHSLAREECERWLARVEAGNLYVNRGTTGAVVGRQPFGGWKRSSVGPTSKAGGAHYVDSLRAWPAVRDVDAALAAATTWWLEVGSRARDVMGLRAERNLLRYTLPPKPILARLDESVSAEQLRYLRGLVAIAGLHVEFSAPTVVRGVLDLTLESVEELVARAGAFTRVRWLSREGAPVLALLDAGVTTDPRALAQRGDVELPRWLLEQSVAITNHRYGNASAGPNPACPGLATSAG